MNRAVRQMPTAPSDDPAFAALKAAVIARTGHHYYADKDDQLWERLAQRMAARGIDTPAAYLALLDGDTGAAEWTALASEVTINETFFFRFAEQFDMLRRSVLPKLIEARRETRRLRIWSVGCSTGAEPYSIAILLRDLIGADIADWRIAITGTDIDERALATARAGLFTPWALRTLDEDARTRMFDREGEQYRLKAVHRGLVRFESHNMVDLLDPASALQFTDFDLILCRNVLIYFHHDMATAMVGRMVDRLAVDGTLLLGHAEPNPAFETVARQIEIDGMVAYRRRGAATEPMPPTVEPIHVPNPIHAAAPALRPPVAIVPPRRARQQPAAPAPAADAPEDAIAAARIALGQGDGAAAMRLATSGMAAAPRDPVPHYLSALGALALGQDAAAEAGFRRALYLDSGFAMAHYMFGRHLLARGRDGEGRRAIGNALRLVLRIDAETPLPEGDGMTAGAVVAAARHAIGAAA
ncbi:CheR family methyltransferase [Sphingomonas sp. 1P06PA]|uniref:CheR family methyltransferase n=1 Tax=Sphingomonas sp. 1P06PA TaxID=554121 RepID=UPI0039A72AC9